MITPLIFAGTTEGREISLYLNNCGVKGHIFTATEYGMQVLPNMENMEVHSGRLDVSDMAETFSRYDNPVIIDATHPYADIVSRNLYNVCNELNIKYYRLLRPSTYKGGHTVFENTKSAIEYLKGTQGNILLATGSKELYLYKEIGDMARLFPRVLPAKDIIGEAIELGYLPKNIICMQGPFSVDMNVATLKQIKGKYLVTKDTGKSGGFDEKLEAAEKAGAELIIIGRPTESVQGYDYESLINIFKQEYNIYETAKQEEEKKYPYFPLFIDLSDKKILVIGCGQIGARRINSLKKFCPNIKVVSKDIDNLDSDIEVIEREFILSDIEDDLFMVITATNDHELNKKIIEECKKKKIAYYNNAGSRYDCNFYFPAIIENSKVVGGIVSKTGENHKSTAHYADIVRGVFNEQER